MFLSYVLLQRLDGRYWLTSKHNITKKPAVYQYTTGLFDNMLKLIYNNWLIDYNATTPSIIVTQIS